MSAPDTNIDKQTRRHKPSLFGIALALIVAAVAAAVFIAWDGLEPESQAAPVTVQGADQ
ncbi:hypothetical protein [Gymnodinialimonas ulvae]|uniref:hypothetical protein n=1 Tax=Gymnodinialimonas ulvae TaxID=3126504 RepID=UPI0030AF6432